MRAATAERVVVTSAMSASVTPVRCVFQSSTRHRGLTSSYSQRPDDACVSYTETLLLYDVCH